NVPVAGFVDAFTNSGTLLVPQNGTAQKLDTLGDKIMTPLVYRNSSGTESLWASQTVILNYPNGPTAIRWYQMNVTGGNFPATPVQQQSWTNGSDGLWRWMPSIAVDQNGNMAIGYSTSSATQEPSIRYAGRLAADPLNNLGQGEAIMTAGGGHQTHSSGRWGDYSYTSIDPVDNLTFWHTNEYYSATSSSSWNTRIGKFKFPSPPQLASVVSQKTHGSTTFDLTLNPDTPATIEPRQGGSSSGDHTLVFSFVNTLNLANPVSSITATAITSGGTEMPATTGSLQTDAHLYRVDLTGVPNASH